MKWSKYNTSWNKDGKMYIYNSIHNKLAVSTDEEFSNTEYLNQLSCEGFRVNSNETEEQTAREKIKEKIHTSETLACWIFLTNDCNLACPYCFEKDSLLNKPANYMEKETCIKTVEWILRKASEKKVKKIQITMTGGEPLINKEAIRTLTEGFSNNEFEVNFNMITNGVLLDYETIKELKTMGITSYQITLDGPAKIHDSRRIYKDGRGTFNIIVNNVMKTLRSDDEIQFTIRINVDEGNCKHIGSLLSLLKRVNLNRYTALCISDTLMTDGTDTGNMLKENIRIIREAVEHGFKIAYGEINNCWMMSEFWYMVNVDGKLYKCPSLVGDEKYSVGSVTESKLNQEYIRQIGLEPWESCINCELAGVCCGGCPYRSVVSGGKWHERKVCRKNYMKELIQLKYSKEINIGEV